MRIRVVSITRSSGGEIAAIHAGIVELLRLLVLHFPDAAEVVIAIRPDGGVRRTVQRTAGVVVDHRLVVEVDDVERAVGADAGFDRTEPHVAAADELGLLAARFLARRVADAVRRHELLMDDVERRLAGEVA